jgi:hypothetical protein
MLDVVGLKHLPCGGAFDSQRRSHALSALMLATKVMFVP